MNRTVAFVTLILSLALRLLAQDHAGRSFDVASIKPIDPDCIHGRMRFETSTGRILLGCVTARSLIALAYNGLHDGHRNIGTTGGPSWLNSLRFTVEAKAEDAAPAEMLEPMLQELMKERFHLQIHIEPREAEVYFLTRGDRQIKLKSADSKACIVRDLTTSLPPMTPPVAGQPPQPLVFCGSANAHSEDIGIANVESRSVTMEAFAEVLTQHAGRPVIDRTGITGKYDINLQFARETAGGAATFLNGELVDIPKSENSAGVPSFYRALQDETGLKLVSGKAPLDIIVVDHVEQPSPN